MISIFHEATAKVAATPDTPWLKLEAGDALVLDNYRMFHGKKPALVFLVHFTMMKHAIILPRQARDRHRNNSQRQTTVDVCPKGERPTRTQTGCSGASGSGLQRARRCVSETETVSPLYFIAFCCLNLWVDEKCEHLPRQARDKHGQDS